MTTEKKLAQKMADAALEIGFGVEKDGRNQSQGYSFTSAAHVKKVCGRAIAKQGIAVSSAVEILRSDGVPTKSGSVQDRHLVRITLTFTDGVESLSVQGLGCGMDVGDKAVMKAYTAAEKYAYISAFSLAMGEDPEWDDDAEPEPQRAPARQQKPVDDAAFAQALSGSSGKSLAEVASVEALRSWMKEHVPVLGQMPSAKKKEALSAMVQAGARFELEERDIRAIIDEIRAS